ncbi:MAG: hypothetical protein Q4D21_03110 [Phascolarctobacterium sp.]|nr:hypothetical protein [Phascolarctobacterium sp.]
MKKILAVTALSALMAITTSAFAGEITSSNIYRDDAGNLHYVKSVAAQSVIDKADIGKDGIWIVPDKVKAMTSETIPCHKVMNMTEEEYEAFISEGQGGCDDSNGQE